jgi:hypothetical protein
MEMNEEHQENVALDQSKLGPLTTPLSFRGVPIWLVYLSAALGIVYLLNPTAGVIEFIPDNIPLIGNIDESVAAFLIWYGLVELFEGRKDKGTAPTEE